MKKIALALIIAAASATASAADGISVLAGAQTRTTTETVSTDWGISSRSADPATTSGIGTQAVLGLQYTRGAMWGRVLGWRGGCEAVAGAQAQVADAVAAYAGAGASCGGGSVAVAGLAASVTDSVTVRAELVRPIGRGDTQGRILVGFTF